MTAMHDHIRRSHLTAGSIGQHLSGLRLCDSVLRPSGWSILYRRSVEHVLEILGHLDRDHLRLAGRRLANVEPPVLSVLLPSVVGRATYLGVHAGMTSGLEERVRRESHSRSFAIPTHQLLRSRVAPTASATASPNIGSPRMIPKTGPGNVMAIKNSVLIKAYTTPTTPLAASSPATRKDLHARGTANVAIARTATPIPGHGASPARDAPPIAITTTNTTSVAAASPIARMVLELATEPPPVSSLVCS